VWSSALTAVICLSVLGLLALIFIGLPIVLFIDSLFALAGNKPINKQSQR
jgi:hypothetical protein